MVGISYGKLKFDPELSLTQLDTTYTVVLFVTICIDFDYTSIFFSKVRVKTYTLFSHS